MCVLLGTAGQAARQFDEERMTVQRFYRVHRFLGQLCRKLSAFLQPSKDGKVDFSLAASLPIDFPSVAASPSISRISSSIWNARPSFSP